MIPACILTPWNLIHPGTCLETSSYQHQIPSSSALASVEGESITACHLLHLFDSAVQQNLSRSCLPLICLPHMLTEW